MRLPLIVSRAVLFVSMLLVLVACQRLGPSAVKVGMPAYNLAISETGHQLLLLNFVRMRYSESPYFMGISNVFASPSYTVSAEAGGTFASGGGDLGVLGGELSYGEAPIIVYTPLTGEGFARRLLQPVGMENIDLLYKGGWNFDRIFRLCVQRINNVWNAEAATGPTPSGRTPEYAKFRRVAKTLHWLETNQLIEVISKHQDIGREEGESAENKNQERVLEVVIHPSIKQKAKVQQFLADLELDPKAKSYFFTNKRFLEDDRIVTIVTRPLIATMFYLSKGIAIPQQDIEKGAVHITQDDDGKPFDWHLVTENLFTVESSSSKPNDAFVAVQYRNSWFYIRDSDVISKDTFTMFEMLLALRAGEIPESRTPITLPVR
jgi:hypothetical protein